MKLLALGDSYTIGEGVLTAESWPYLLQSTLRKLYDLKLEVKVVAKTGWTSGDLLNELDVLAPAESYDVISLLIGANNIYQGRALKEYEEDLNALVRFAKAGSVNVMVLSIPDYGYTPFGAGNKKGISEKVDLFNKIAQSLAYKHNCVFIDITKISRTDETDLSLLTKDQLHPSEKQYNLWVSELVGIDFWK